MLNAAEIDLRKRRAAALREYAARTLDQSEVERVAAEKLSKAIATERARVPARYTRAQIAEAEGVAAEHLRIASELGVKAADALTDAEAIETLTRIAMAPAAPKTVMMPVEVVPSAEGRDYVRHDPHRK